MNAYTCGRVPSRALSHKSTYTLNLCSVFHYLALMYKSDPPQYCYYISIFANIWYLIKLIHSIIIILRVFVFYKQHVLANFWGRKDSAICASRMRSGHYFPIWHLCTSRTHLNVAIISLYLANIWYLIKLFHSIIIILRVFMFYKQRVLANFWGRKDIASCASRKRSGHYFPIRHLCTSRTHLNIAIISLFLANIWYLITLIHSIIIILRVFMFYKQRVLANFWGRKDSAICASRKRNGHYFPIWHLCTSRTHFNVAIISLFLANIWYLIKLIHWIIIILRVFMFYKQRVLANVWGRKDSTICASRKRSGACFCAVHMKWAINSLFMPTTLSFRPQKSAKTRYI